MWYLNELNPEANNLHERVVKIIERTGMEPVPVEIIDSCANAIIKLNETNSIEKSKDLLSIIISYRDHIVYNDLIFSVINVAMDVYTSQAQSIAKSAMKNTPKADFSKIYELLSKRNKDKGSRYILRKYFDKSVETLEDILNSKEKTCMNGMILAYLKKAEMVSDDEIRQLVNKITKNENRNMEILSYLYKFHGNNRINKKIVNSDKNDEDDNIISTKLIGLTEDEIFTKNHSEKQIEKFVTTFVDLLYPHFISLIYSINLIYLNEGKMMELLKKIVRYIGISNFIKIVKPLNVEKHFLIFKDIKNVDLSILMLLYNDSNENLMYLLDGLAGFCSFSTDYNGNIEKLLLVLKHVFTINYKKGCAALEKLISTHLFNLRNECVLPNPVPKEDSLRILEAVKLSSIHEAVFELFVKYGDNELSELIKLLIEVCGIDLTSKLSGIIMGTDTNTKVSLVNALKLMVYFVDKLEINFETNHKLVEVCTDGAVNEQKASYDLLKAIKAKNNKWCVCELLFNHRILSGGASKSKNRLALLYTILCNRCCDCQCIDMVDKFLNELINLSISGNIKSRKMAREIINELQENEEFRKFIVERSGVFSENITILKGCLNAGYIILESVLTKYKYLGEKLSEKDEQFLFEFSRCIFAVAMSHEAVVNDVLKICGLIYSLESANSMHEEISTIVVNYIKNFRKHNREIRECLISANKNNVPLSKEMKVFLSNKNKGGKAKLIQVVKNRK